MWASCLTSRYNLWVSPFVFSDDRHIVRENVTRGKKKRYYLTHSCESVHERHWSWWRTSGSSRKPRGLLRENGRGRAGSGFTPTTPRYFSHVVLVPHRSSKRDTSVRPLRGQPVYSCRDSWAEGCLYTMYTPTVYWECTSIWGTEEDALV